MFLLTALAFLSAAAVSQVQVSASVDTSRPIYLGTQFSYSITIENGEAPQHVNLAPLSEFHPSGPSQQSRTSIVNGRVSSSVVLSYALTAPRLGTVTIPAVEVAVQGQTYRTRPVTVRVVQPGQTQQMDIEMALSEQECYVGQPILLTVSFYVWLDIAREEAIANIQINIPVLESSSFYVEDPDALPFAGTQTALIVNGQRQIMVQDRADHKGVSCVRVRLAKILIPRQPGTIEFEPAAAGADIAVGRQRSGRDPFFDDFFRPRYEYQRFGCSSEPLQLSVQPLPTEGRPDGFYGLVGRYTIEAEASPTQVHVGDPITLTIRIGGSRYLKPVQWPDLEAIPGLIEDFKIPSERADAEITDSQKVFSQTIRAAHENVKEIPPIPLSFFDIVKKQYTTIRTRAIPLEVAPTRIVTQADVESRGFSSPSRQIAAVREGLSANITGPEALVNQHVTLLSAAASPLVLILWFGPLSVWLLSVLYKFSVRTSPQRRAAKRRRTAANRAIHSVRTAEKQDSAAPVLGLALKQYIADKLNKSAGALTASECESLLSRAGADAQSAGRYRQMMDTLEAAEYSPTPYLFTKEQKETMIRLIREIEKQIQ